MIRAQGVLALQNRNSANSWASRASACLRSTCDPGEKLVRVGAQKRRGACAPDIRPYTSTLPRRHPDWVASPCNPPAHRVSCTALMFIFLHVCTNPLDASASRSHAPTRMRSVFLHRSLGIIHFLAECVPSEYMRPRGKRQKRKMATHKIK